MLPNTDRKCFPADLGTFVGKSIGTDFPAVSGTSVTKVIGTDFQADLGTFVTKVIGKDFPAVRPASNIAKTQYSLSVYVADISVLKYLKFYPKNYTGPQGYD